jgi:hypothetical protein
MLPNQMRLHGPFPLPCNSFGQSAAEPPTRGNAGIPVLDRCRRSPFSRLYTRKKRVPSQWPARLYRVAGQRRFAVAWASAVVCARNPAAVSRDVVFPEPISAQPATKIEVIAAAKMKMTFKCERCVFICVALVSELNRYFRERSASALAERITDGRNELFIIERLHEKCDWADGHGGGARGQIFARSDDDHFCAR